MALIFFILEIVCALWLVSYNVVLFLHWSLFAEIFGPLERFWFRLGIFLFLTLDDSLSREREQVGVLKQSFGRLPAISLCSLDFSSPSERRGERVSQRISLACVHDDYNDWSCSNFQHVGILTTGGFGIWGSSTGFKNYPMSTWIIVSVSLSLQCPLPQ